jgi:hypothetical protein
MREPHTVGDPHIGPVSAKAPARTRERNLEHHHTHIDVHPVDDGSCPGGRIGGGVRLEFDAIEFDATVDDPGPPTRVTASPVTVPLGKQPSGTVTLSWDSQTKNFSAKLQMVGFTPGSSHAMHIHQGSCAEQGDVLVPFPDVIANDSGAIDTTVTSSQPAAAGLAVGTFLNIHLAPAAQLGAPGSLGYTPISCADITPSASTTLTMAPPPQPGQAPQGSATFTYDPSKKTLTVAATASGLIAGRRPRRTYPPRLVRRSGGGPVPTRRSGGLAHRCRRDDDSRPECRTGPTGVGLVPQRPPRIIQPDRTKWAAHALFRADHLRQHRQVAFNIGCREDRYPAGMPVDEVVRTVTAVAGGLDYAHYAVQRPELRKRGGAKGIRTPDPHTASVKTPVLQRVTASTVYRIMPACNPSSY